MRIANGGAFVRISPEGGAGRVKRCAGCQRDKPLAAFTKGSGPGGLHRHCRDCCRAWRRMHKRQA
jgi:hypothetical protein